MLGVLSTLNYLGTLKITSIILSLAWVSYTEKTRSHQVLDYYRDPTVLYKNSHSSDFIGYKKKTTRILPIVLVISFIHNAVGILYLKQ